MQHSGIIRKIDKLGRIVIPKEIRNLLRIFEDDNLELFIDNETIILKKYSYIKSINDVAQTLINSIKKGDYNIIIYDSSSIIASSKNYKYLIDKMPTMDMLKYIPLYNSVNLNEKMDIIPNKEIYIKPILSNGIFIANIILFSDKLVDYNKNIIDYIGNFIGKYMEI